MAPKRLKVKDRVVRKTGSACVGTVVDIRTEITNSSVDPKDRGLLVQVQWDNGTLSYFTPEGLESVAER